MSATDIGIDMARDPQPSRAGLVQQSVWIEPSERKALKQIAIENDTTVQDMLRQCVSDLLAKHGRTPPTAQ